MNAHSIVEQARRAFDRRAWREAFDLFSEADGWSALAAPDLERFGHAAFLLNRSDHFMRALDRAYHVHADAGEHAPAARCAFWLALGLTFAGRDAQASGWLSRAHHLIERAGDCVERGYVILPEIERYLVAGDARAALAASATAVEIGERFRDPDLVACARHTQGRALVRMNEVDRGLTLLDEAMVAVLSEDLSPVFTGLVYCSVIETCMHLHALARAREWTAALADWCKHQSQLVAFTGTCLVHRAEVLFLQGNWTDSMNEARRACQRFEDGQELRPPAAAYYWQGEAHRLQGRGIEAEAAYRSASQWGLEPQPGLALLRLAQGDIPAAVAAIRRALDAVSDRAERSRLLPASVEIACAAADAERAHADCGELEAIADALGSEALRAVAAYSRGIFELARDAPQAAIAPLRAAFQAWRRLEAPYFAARARLLLSRAYTAVGDADGAALERDAARTEFQRLDAKADLAALERDVAPPAVSGGLTARELQVLRLVARGRTNKAIARELKISGKTVDRHLSNIFTKLGVSARAAAVAYAYQYKLI